jgi:hypothetical protein
MKPEKENTKYAIAEIVRESIDGLVDGKYSADCVKGYLTNYITTRVLLERGLLESYYSGKIAEAKCT